MKKICLLALAIVLFSCTKTTKEYREIISLEGEWQFALDPERKGEVEKWYLTELDDQVILPGTTDENKKGWLNRDTTTLHLNRLYKYYGPAWYKKKVSIPESFNDKHITLKLERSKPSSVWIDSTYIGSSKLLQSAQLFDASKILTPGEHTITIMVNNDLRLTPYGNVHIYSDDTQTNWNGILGEMSIEASAKTFIKNVRVFPNIKENKITIEAEIENGLDLELFDIELLLEKLEKEKKYTLKSSKHQLVAKNRIELEYDLGDKCKLWDEYTQTLYDLTIILKGDKHTDSKTVRFGMREFSVSGTQFSINGRTCFLRGKHEAAVFPLSGHTPMDVEEWQRVFRIAKSYGINHYRFHSYCPPEAAFLAADLEGIYLQPELPFWGGLDSDSIAEMQLKEGYAMLDAYANHPSFVMFSHGNEIWSGHDRVEANIIALKGYDSRPLYTMGCNNGIGYIPPRECSEFFIGARTPYAHDTILTHTRLTHAFADSRDGASLNTLTPSTLMNFDYPVSQLNMPIISHEIGQYQIYPDYKEIEKYTGVLRAWNLEKFKARLEQKGMGKMDSIFQKASGAWSALCYKAEMEAALRTGGLAGFQLLDLQDFPGQGTALVGILDAFMDSKEVVTEDSWKQSCNDVVLLLEFPKYCWTNQEYFSSALKVANYSNKNYNKDIHWRATKANGEILQEGTISSKEFTMGKLSEAGTIDFPLTAIKKAEKLCITCSMPGTAYQNNYNIWIYPDDQLVEHGNVSITERFDNEILQKLNNGENILYFPDTRKTSLNSIPGLFPPDFWNWGMFKSISENNGKPVSPGTLGLLMDNTHPLFRDFPTDFHTNWHWFSIIKNSSAIILDWTGNEYYPIVQVIDNLERNHKLGMIFEFSVGKGKLLVCTSQLNRIENLPEAQQLYASILNYMNSGDFNPHYALSSEQLNRFLVE